MAGELRVFIVHEADIVTARMSVRQLASEIEGFSETAITLIATAVSELARNILLYAGRGEIVLRPVGTNGSRGITLVARDEGPGIADLALAMEDGYSTSGGLGLGLPGTRRLMDEFRLVSEVGRGTEVIATKWAST